MRTISSWWVFAMAETFKWHELPLSDLFAKANISLDSLGARDSRYPQDNVSVLWREAQALCPARNLAVDVAQALNVRSLPVIGLAMLQMDSVEQGFALMLRYQKLLGGNTNARLIEHPKHTRELRFHFANERQPIPAQSYEAAMAFCVKVARTLVGKSWNPTKVCVQRSEPCPHLQAYFGCPIEYGRAHHQIFFTADANFSAHETLNTVDVTKHRAITQVLALVLEQQLALGQVSAKRIAAQLSMSEKTLQRRLASEGTSFRAELEALRRHKSASLLSDTQLSISEVAYLCGYSEISAFHHAFSRWFGCSPSRYRANITTE
ncbi:AraC family transcriptional regulator ligand-binding domain-containing protein [Pseudoalteromonas sp. SSDWG2]|uniref:AraC family transcriptional regulator n=1 Tax=Pseudoalteromonas sp. SSDWG2 TaxID=3139391 RepID=UPI003BABDB19